MTRDFYKTALGIAYNIPSEETLRQRMDDIGSSLREHILEENVELLRMNGIVASKLPNGFVPVDIDVTPFDNSKTRKEWVSRTYKGYDGYAPSQYHQLCWTRTYHFGVQHTPDDRAGNHRQEKNPP